MTKEKTYYNVKNRSTSMVIYRIPEDGIRREFAPGETKRISYRELEKLSYQAGGRNLMACFLQLTNEDVLDALNIHAEDEYYMSEEQVVDLIQNGTLDEFLDCLDLAPVGVIDLVKKYSVELPMNDNQKRDALKQKTGFDVTMALTNSAENDANDNKALNEKVSEDHPTRRTAPKYKVTEKKEN